MEERPISVDGQVVSSVNFQLIAMLTKETSRDGKKSNNQSTRSNILILNWNETGAFHE